MSTSVQQQYPCASCGAALEFTPQTTTAVSGRCPSCRGAYVVTDDLAGRLKAPDGIVPFVVDKDHAAAAFREWAGSRWFAPRALKDVVRADSMVGRYLPHWGFDDRTTSDYTGQRGEHYWETETYTETVGDHQETRTRQVQGTRWYSASGRVSRDFVDLVVPAVTEPSGRTLDKLGPWAAADATGYRSEFLAGFDTPRCTVSAEAGFDQAREEMATVIERDCRADIGGDEQRVREVRTTDSDVLAVVVLLVRRHQG